MNVTTEKEINIVNNQLIALFIFIISLIVSILLTYNEKLRLENRELLFNEKLNITISLINRIVVVLLGIYFIYDAFERKKLNNETGKRSIPNSNSNDNLQILASCAAFLSSLISLYIILINLKNVNFDVSGVEEPAL